MNKHKIFKALSWSFIGSYSNQIVLFIVGIILARILEPKDFGIISMILVFSSYGQIFIDLGFNSSIIQDKNASDENLSTIFFLNVLIGFLLTIILFFCAGPIANFYKEPGLIKITKFMSLIFIIYSISSIQRTIIIKKIDFKTETIIILTASLISGGISIYLALTGYGPWALAWKIILQKSIETLLLWFLSSWRPSLIFKIGSVKKYLNYSMNIAGASLLNGLTQNLDRLIVGKIYSAEILGFFDRAKKYNNLITSNIGNTFGKVMFPVFSEIQDDRERLLRIYKKAVSSIFFFTFPFFLILILIAKPLIIVLITERWLSSVKMLQILAISGFTYPVSMVMVKFITGIGRADIFFRLDIIKTLLFVSGIFIGSIWGIIGVVYAITIVNFLGLIINMVAIKFITGLRLSEQSRSVLPTLFNSILMFFIIFGFDQLINFNNLYQILSLTITGFIMYLLLSYLNNLEIVSEILLLFKTKNFR